MFFYFQTISVIAFAVLLMAAVFTEEHDRSQAFDKSDPALRSVDIHTRETDILSTEDCEQRRSHYDERRHGGVQK